MPGNFHSTSWITSRVLSVARRIMGTFRSVCCVALAICSYSKQTAGSTMRTRDDGDRHTLTNVFCLLYSMTISWASFKFAVKASFSASSVVDYEPRFFFANTCLKSPESLFKLSCVGDFPFHDRVQVAVKMSRGVSGMKETNLIGGAVADKSTDVITGTDICISLCFA